MNSSPRFRPDLASVGLFYVSVATIEFGPRASLPHILGMHPVWLMLLHG